MSDNRVHVRVWGDFACFTRPEMKVERVSYPIMTPSAARGAMEAIFWEPQIYYLIDRIKVIKKGRWFSLRKNEITAQTSLKAASEWMKKPEKFSPISAGGGADDGTQRSTLCLCDVEYIISVEVRLTELGKAAPGGIQKYLSEIRNRATAGKCFSRPYLGLREFAADFEFVESPEKTIHDRSLELGIKPENLWPQEDLGIMLYDLFDLSDRNQGFQWLNSGSQASSGADGKLEAAAAEKSGMFLMRWGSHGMTATRFSM